MALDELLARRLATVGNVFDAALGRMELVLRPPEEGTSVGGAARLSDEQTCLIQGKMALIRSRLQEGLRHFSVQLRKPEPKQMLAAELSMLWVVLENARPERMKGYALEFAPQDKTEWDSLVQTLLNEIESLRTIVLKGRVKD